MTDMAEVRVEELTGPALRYAVLHAISWERLGAIGVTSEAEYAEGVPLCKMGHNDWWRDPEGLTWCAPCEGLPEPDRDWHQCGPLIERFLHSLFWFDDHWTASPVDDEYDTGIIELEGETPLVAACRAIVASVNGDTARVPAELVEGKQ